MSAEPENPKAFPRQDDIFEHGEVGMTLRDYYAGQALIGIVSSNDPAVGKIAQKSNTEVQDLVAEMSYVYADAMLAERSKS